MLNEAASSFYVQVQALALADVLGAAVGGGLVVWRCRNLPHGLVQVLIIAAECGQCAPSRWPR
jgi:hypothetical protein